MLVTCFHLHRTIVEPVFISYTLRSESIADYEMSYPEVSEGIVARPISVRSGIRSLQELGLNTPFIPIPNQSLVTGAFIPNALVFPGEIDIVRFENAVSWLGALWPSLNARFVARTILDNDRLDDFAVIVHTLYGKSSADMHTDSSSLVTTFYHSPCRP
jgi:hypothetical protein